jgi:hypothetical protein
MLKAVGVPQMVVELHDDCHLTDPPQGFPAMWQRLSDEERERYLDDPQRYVIETMESALTC